MTHLYNSSRICRDSFVVCTDIGHSILFSCVYCHRNIGPFPFIRLVSFVIIIQGVISQYPKRESVVIGNFWDCSSFGEICFLSYYWSQFHEYLMELAGAWRVPGNLARLLFVHYGATEILKLSPLTRCYQG